MLLILIVEFCYLSDYSSLYRSEHTELEAKTFHNCAHLAHSISNTRSVIFLSLRPIIKFHWLLTTHLRVFGQGTKSIGHLSLFLALHFILKGHIKLRRFKSIKWSLICTHARVTWHFEITKDNSYHNLKYLYWKYVHNMLSNRFILHQMISRSYIKYYEKVSFK